MRSMRFIISEALIAILTTIIIVVIGLSVLFITGETIANIGTLITGILWGTVIPILVWGFRQKIKFRNQIAKILGFYDPLKGLPDNVVGGVRSYGSRVGLTDMVTILSIPTLSSVDILSITSYLLILTYSEEIHQAASRGIKFNFSILNPEDVESVDGQTKIYGGKNIRQQLETSLSELCKIKDNLTENKKKNITVNTYKGILKKGIVIAHDTDPKFSWAKTERFTVNQSANSRHNEAAYFKDNEDFYNRAVEEFERKTKTRYNFP
jgi:hypothetical protein